MYNSFSGIITEKGINYFCIQLGGIEYFLNSSYNTLDKLILNKETKVFVFLQHKEDGMSLFGFATKDERLLFLDLIKVNGVGPKAAQKILSGIKPNDFIACLENEDISRLSKIPGLGLKTAQKIVLALKGKLKLVEDVITQADSTELDKEILDSLVAMGFDKKKSKDNLTLVLASGITDEGEILRQTIIKLSS